MNTAEWKELLTQWSGDILDSSLAQQMRYRITPEMVASRWLGYPGATEAELATAEARLGTRLPPSYRAFLQVTNGWSVLTQRTGLLWPTEEVGWLRDKDPEVIEIWGKHEPDVPDSHYFVYGQQQDAGAFRARYFHTGLQISDPNYLDGEFYMLNPQVVSATGEWEAWFFAHWLPGVQRYRSFWELMQAEYEMFLALRDI